MSEMIITLLIGFLAGLAVGAGALAYFTFVYLRSKAKDIYAKNKDFFDNMASPPVIPRTSSMNDPNLNESVILRLRKAQEITARQNEITAATSQPSANALHSKHKNQMVSQYKQLEKEKFELLKSIVSDGFDPHITIFNTLSNQQEEMPLSQFLNSYAFDTNGEKAAAATTPKTDPKGITKPDDIRKVEKNGKTFYVIDGGKSKKPTTH